MTKIVYAIINEINGKQYIGQTARRINQRWNDHKKALRDNCHSNPHLQNAWNKYGESNFKCRVIMNVKTQQEADNYEILLMRQYSPNIYNIKPGGKTGIKLTLKHRKTMSQAQRKLARPSQFFSEISKKRWKTPESHIWRKETNIKMWSDPAKRKKMLNNLMPYATNSQWKRKLSKSLWKQSEYRSKFEKSYGNVKSPTGKVYTVVGLRKFCRKHRLDSSTLSKVCSGQFIQHKGWTKYND